MEIKTITYEEERLLYFMEKMEKAKKRYERLHKTYQDESYLSEESQKLADAGRELRFYEDVVALLKANEQVPSDLAVKVAKAEAYSEFAEKFKKEYPNKYIVWKRGTCCVLADVFIDQLMKKLVEGI